MTDPAAQGGLKRDRDETGKDGGGGVNWKKKALLGGTGGPVPAGSPQPQRVKSEGDKTEKLEIELKQLVTKLEEATTQISVLQEELDNTQFDLRHEQKKWRYFRSKAKKQAVWSCLFGAGGEKPKPRTEAEPKTPVTSSLPETNEDSRKLVDEIEDLKTSQKKLLEDVKTLEADKERLSKQLEQETAKAKENMELREEKVVAHPAYQYLYTAFKREELFAQRLLQQNASLRQTGYNDVLEKEKERDQVAIREGKKVAQLEAMLTDRDNRLVKVKDEIRSLHVQVEKVKIAEQQLKDEQAKVTKYSSLNAQLKDQVEKLKRVKDWSSDEMAAEYESLAASYDTLRESNEELLKRIDEKDKANATLRTEKIKAQGELQLSKQVGEQVKQTSRAQLAAFQASAAVCQKQADIIADLRTAEARLRQQLGDVTSEISKMEKDRDTAQRRYEDTQRQLATLKEDHKDATGQLSSLREEGRRHSAHANALARDLEVAKKRAERADERRKSSELIRLDSSKLSKDAKEFLAMEKQVKVMEGMLKCNVCHTKEKNTIITRCLHVFCKPCIDTRVAQRDRYCPMCGLKFAESDVKPIALFGR